MLQTLHALDAILRGQVTDPGTLSQHTFRVPVAALTALLVVLGALHGFVPALFFLALLVTFPSLYVFNALVGSRLELWPLLRLMVASLAVMLAVLASFGPIVAFFSVCTTSYGFMILLNVAAFALAGALGLKFLHQTLQRLTTASVEPARTSTVETGAVDLGALDPAPGPHLLTAHVRTVFVTWMLLFGLVGSQMAWVLRPFVGDPERPFTWFRERESSFFEAVWRTLETLVG
jgi:hypothetical protein